MPPPHFLLVAPYQALATTPFSHITYTHSSSWWCPPQWSALKFCRPLSTWLEASAWTQRGTFPPSFSPCFLTLPTSNPLQEQRRQPLLQQRQHHRHGFDRGPKRPARPKEQQGAGAAPELICLDLHDRKRPRARPPARYAWKTYACVLRLKAYGRYRDNLRDGVVALRP